VREQARLASGDVSDEQNLRALVRWRRKRLYFRMAHLTSVSLKWRKTGYNMDL
jgi:hypothetical protein